MNRVAQNKGKGAGVGYFAGKCLAPASKACKGRSDFQACRREFIAKCK